MISSEDVDLSLLAVRAFRERMPVSDQQLWLWLEQQLGYAIAYRATCPEHVAPFTFMADAFFQRFAAGALHGPRGGGKTRGLSMLHLLNGHFRPGFEAAHIGSIMRQGIGCYRYFKEYFRDAYLSSQLIGDPLMQETNWLHGAKLQILPATIAGTSGPHPNLAVADEFDLLPWDVYQQFIGMPMSNGRYEAQSIYTSAMVTSFGPMARLIEEAGPRGLNVYKSCVFDSMQWCETCEDADNAARGIKANPPACPLWNDCQGRCHAVDKNGRPYATGHIRKADVIARFQQSDEDTWCLHQDARVALADGRRKSVADMVRERDPGPVLSLENGRLVAKRVTNWATSPLARRRWVRLGYQHARTMGPGGTKRRGLWVTEEHQVLTPDGWRRADSLRDGDLVVTDELSPNEAQEELLVGMLLGNASIWRDARNPKGRACLDVGHALADHEWVVDVGALALGSLVKPVASTIGVRYISHCAGYWQVLHDRWYPQGKKVVDHETVERCFGPRMLAAWFLDSGYLYTRGQAELSTHCFNREDVDWLVGLLVRHGYDALAYPVARGDKAKGTSQGQWRINLTVAAAEKLLEVVSPFVPPTMRRKLHEEDRRTKTHRNRPGRPKTEPVTLAAYDASLWDLGEGRPFIDAVDIGTGKQPCQKTAYCLTVEDTGLFFAGGLAVHNSVQYLCTRGSSKGLVYEHFDAAVGPIGTTNVSNEAEFKPEFPVVWLCDSGYSPDPSCILAANVMPNGDLHVFDEIFCTRTLDATLMSYLRTVVLDEIGRTAEKWVWQEVAWSDTETRPTGRTREYRKPSAAYCGASDKQLQANIAKLGVPIRVPTKTNVIDGIGEVRKLIRDANGHRSLSFHPRCRHSIQMFSLYHRRALKNGEYDSQPADNTGRSNPDDACDAVRMYSAYLLESRNKRLEPAWR